MKVRYMSDLHFGPNHKFPYSVKEDDSDLLILAGDVCDGTIEGHDQLRELCDKFPDVFYVPGNHEFYHGQLGMFAYDLEKNMGTLPSNLHLAECDSFEKDNVVFCGATMWTNLFNYNYALASQATTMIKDFTYIRSQGGGQLMSIDLWYQTHIQHLDYFKAVYDNCKEQGKTFVGVTHHCPTDIGVHPVFRGNGTNCVYFSDLSDFYGYRDIPFMVYGHMHHAIREEHIGTTFLCNPRGYVGKDKFIEHDTTQFDPNATFEVT
jgi:predicted phosphodiesterase